MSVLSIIPQLPAQSIGLTLATGGQPKSRAEIVSGATGSLPGVEIMLQKLLQVRGEIGGPEKAKAEREAPVREFHGAPITYDGFGNSSRQPPPMMVFAVA
jgi:hypothetical protein